MCFYCALIPHLDVLSKLIICYAYYDTRKRTLINSTRKGRVYFYKKILVWCVTFYIFFLYIYILYIYTRTCNVQKAF